MKLTAKQISVWCALVIILVPLALVAYLGTFTRFHADDFCAVGQMRISGFWPALEYWYKSWNGRFAFTFFSQGFGGLGTPFARILPGLILLVWMIGLSMIFSALLRSWTHRIRSQYPPHTAPTYKREGFLLSAACLYLVLYSIPNLFQSFLWESGLVNYTLPLVFITYLAAILLRIDQNRTLTKGGILHSFLMGISLFVMAFLSAGFSETHSITQLVFFAGWTGLVLVQKKRNDVRPLSVYLLVTMLGTLAGFAFTALAPGNANRLTMINPGESLFNPINLLQMSVRHAYVTIHAFVRHHWDVLTVITAVAVWVGWQVQKGTQIENTRCSILTLRQSSLLYYYTALPVICFGLVSLAMLPPAYVLNSYPDSRALILHHVIIAVSVIMFAVWSGIAARILVKKMNPRLEQACVGLLLCGLAAVTALSVDQLSSTIPQRKEYAIRWDDRDKTLRQSLKKGEDNVLAAGLEQYFGLHDLAYESSHWINICLAQYYGFTSVSGR